LPSGIEKKKGMASLSTPEPEIRGAKEQPSPGAEAPGTGSAQAVTEQVFLGRKTGKASTR